MTAGPRQLRSRGRALCALGRGEVVLCPTEAVWGLSCDPANPVALRRLLALKRRPPRKGMILVAADRAALRPWVARWRADQDRRLAATWPGPTTWVMRARRPVSPLLSGGRPRLAVRISAHPAVREMCMDYGGALVSTSANLTGTAPARGSRLAALRRFPGHRLPVWPGELGDAERPSRIIDLESGTVLRA